MTDMTSAEKPPTMTEQRPIPTADEEMVDNRPQNSTRQSSQMRSSYSNKSSPVMNNVFATAASGTAAAGISSSNNTNTLSSLSSSPTQRNNKASMSKGANTHGGSSPQQNHNHSHTDPHSNPDQNTLAMHYLAWIEQFAMKHFRCGLCRSMLVDARRLADETFVCSNCALTNNLDSTEAPAMVSAAAAEIKAFLLQPSNEFSPESAIHQRFMATRQVNGASERNTTTFIPQWSGSSLEGDDAAARLRSSTKEREAAANKALFSPEKVAKVGPSLDEIRAQDAIIAREERTRGDIASEQSQHYLDLMKMSSSELRTLKAQRRGSSKKLKMEADDNYERANYTQAIELYTKAIANVGDGTTKLNILHGNRSAALFMALQYDACIEDCLKVVSMEPGNVKLYNRAIKAAIMMGDLERALELHGKVPPNIVTSAMQQDRNKIALACDELKEARKKHGTEEGHRMWELLTTKFSETIIFRMNQADSWAATSRFDMAIDVLSVIQGPSRTPAIAARIAKYHYLSGFEQFEKARDVLAPYTSDRECAALLKLVNAVDDEKQTGNHLFSSRKFADSVVHYTKAIDLDPTNGRILRILYCNRAAAYKELSRLKEGVEDCTKAIELDPTFSKAYARRARCLLLMKDFDSAVRDFRTASQCDKTDNDLRRELASAEEALAKEIEREKDFYYVLGVTRNSNEAEIKSKYRSLSLRWHPDKCMNGTESEKQVAERKFKAIAEAYATLTNADRRREYDLKCDRERYINRPFDTNFARNTASAATSKYTRRHAGTTYGSAYGPSGW